MLPDILVSSFCYVNDDKTKYMVMSWDQKAGRSHYMKMDNISFERVEEFE
jgi:hypothetical protein